MTHWSRGGYAVLLLAALFWTAGFFFSPLMHEWGRDGAAVLGRAFYAPVCHQDAARSFTLFGWPLSVCHRCSSIYLAFTAVVLAAPQWRRMRFFHSIAWPRLAIFILPMLLDYVLDVLGAWNNTPLSRAISGGVAGAGLALFVLPAWMEIAGVKRGRTAHEHKEVDE